MSDGHIELSVIVPIYNVEEYLEECLDSLYAIKGIEKEIILVNDGSKDGSLAIAQRYEAQYPDVTVIVDKRNGGLSSARNAGVKAAKGKYLYFCDSDDYLDVSMFSELFDHAKTLDLDMAIGSYEPFGDITRQYLQYADAAFERDVCTGKEFLLNMYRDSTKKVLHYRAMVVDAIYRRDLLVDNELYFEDGLLHEDELFKPLVYLHAQRVKIYNLRFYQRRVRGDSIMGSFAQRNRNDRIYVSQQLALVYRQYGVNHVLANNRLVHFCWPDAKRIFKKEAIEKITFKNILPILRLKRFGLKEWVKLSVLLLICTRNAIGV